MVQTNCGEGQVVRASDRQETREQDSVIAPRTAMAKQAKQLLIDILPGLLIGTGAVIANMQAGRLSPEEWRSLVPLVLGGAFVAASLRYVLPHKLQPLLGYVAIAVALGLVLLADNPQADIQATEERSFLGPEIVSSSPDETTIQVGPAPERTDQDKVQSEGADEKNQPVGWPTRQPIAEQDRCARFDFGDENRIWALPVSGDIGSRSKPLRVRASSETPLAMSITTEHQTAYELVTVYAQVVVPPINRKVAFGENSLTFEGRTVSSNAVGINRSNELTGVGLDVKEPIPIPFGVIELNGTFSDDEGARRACQFQIYIQLVSRPWENIVALGAALTVVAGVMALLFSLAGGFPGLSQTESAGERFVQMRIEVDDWEEQGFIAGETNNLSFWIGPEVVSEFVHRASHAVAAVGRTITLDATFKWSDGEATSTLTLDADPRNRSEPKFAVDVKIPADSKRFTGRLYLRVRETNKLYEQVKVQGVVGLAGHAERPRLISIVEDREHIERSTQQSTAVGASVVHQGNELLWYSNGKNVTRDATDLMEVEARLSASVQYLQATAGRIDWGDTEALVLLRTIAVEGANLRYAAADGIDPGNALQFLNQQAKTTVPFEWVYDRGTTAPDAQVKPECIASLRQGLDPNRSPDDPFPCGCPPASALSNDVLVNNPILCPWGFWGLAKIIERYDPDPDQVNTIPHPDDGQELPSFSSVLLAADHTVDLPSRQGEEIVDIEGQLAQMTATLRVDTWPDFQAQLESQDNQLVVTLPHQESGTLQIGTDKLLLSQVPQRLSEGHNRVILLLGCQTTQTASAGFVSFARIFKDHAAVVIGSSAILVTSDAARMAIELVQQLEAVAQKGEPLGNAVVAARRQLFADGYPIALAVTALGDAHWRFTTDEPETT